MLSRDAILSQTSLRKVKVTIPEWGGEVHVRTMTAGQRDQFEATVEKVGTGDIRARLAVLTVCDEDGNLLFRDGDIPLLSSLSAKAVNRVFSVATKLNGITAEDVEELKKNSQAILSDDTSSASPDVLDSPSE